MKRKNRAKQLRHKLKQEAYRNRATEKQKLYSGKSDYILDYLREIEAIEKQYNDNLDTYIAEEVERQLTLEPDISRYPIIEPIDYVNEIRNLGLVVSKSDVRVVPDLVELGYIVRGWKADFEQFVASLPENYRDSEFGTMVRDGFIDELSTHFVNNQENPSALRNYMPSLQNYVREVREKYLAQGASTVFEYNNFI